MGIITHSNSPWAYPVVIVPKPDGSIRLCFDYRRVNSLTVPDPFSLPRVKVLVNKLGRANYLTKVDVTRRYWHALLDDTFMPVSAFVTSTGHFQWRLHFFVSLLLYTKVWSTAQVLI